MKRLKTDPQRRPTEALRIAMIGPSEFPEGGTSIPFKILVDRLRASGVMVDIVSIPRGGRNVLTKPLKLLGILRRIARLAPEVDVISAHVPTPQLSNVGLGALAIARLYRRVFVLRQFSGMDASDLPLHKRLLAEHVIKNSTVLFVEARKQCENIRDWLSREAFWYPNYRVTSSGPLQPHEKNGRFVYVGRVRDDKGIGEILKAVALLGGRYCVDIYGPCEEHLGQDISGRSTRVRYRGVVENRDISSILSEYTALLLPTRWAGEGYPGIVIEAFQAGVPVISTRWKYLPEIVDDTCGILVEPGDVEGLSRAMRQLAEDEGLAQRLRTGALHRGKLFSVSRWADLFIQVCYIACEDSRDRMAMERHIKGLYTSIQQVVTREVGTA